MEAKRKGRRAYVIKVDPKHETQGTTVIYFDLLVAGSRLLYDTSTRGARISGSTLQSHGRTMEAAGMEDAVPSSGIFATLFSTTRIALIVHLCRVIGHPVPYSVAKCTSQRSYS